MTKGGVAVGMHADESMPAGVSSQAGITVCIRVFSEGDTEPPR
jgi:hypothetical protein